MGMNANDAAPQQPAARYGPLTKSINVEQTLTLIGLTREFESVKAWQDEALFRLPQASRQRRQEIVRAALHNFLEVESDHFTETPLRTLLTSPLLSSRLKRDLLFAQYLRMTPLVWEAVQQVVLPRAEQAVRSSNNSEDALITLDEWMGFLKDRLSTTTASTIAKTRQHITGHLAKFGLLDTQPVPGDPIARRFFARFYDPEPGAFWYSLALEFAGQGWTSRSLEFVTARSWTRVAYCTTPVYARFVMEEAERAGLVVTDFFGSEKQITLRGPDPLSNVVEAILHG